MSELYHHGIKDQKWGVRRYQNEDGTYTEEGLERRRESNGTLKSKYRNKDGSLTEKGYKKYGPGSRWEKKTAKRLWRYSGHTNNINIAKKSVNAEATKNATQTSAGLAIGMAVASKAMPGPAGIAAAIGGSALLGAGVGLANSMKAQKINKDFDIYYELNKVKGDDIVNNNKDTAIIDINGKKYKATYKT